MRGECQSSKNASSAKRPSWGSFEDACISFGRTSSTTSHSWTSVIGRANPPSTLPPPPRARALLTSSSHAVFVCSSGVIFFFNFLVVSSRNSLASPNLPRAARASCVTKRTLCRQGARALRLSVRAHDVGVGRGGAPVTRGTAGSRGGGVRCHAMARGGASRTRLTHGLERSASGFNSLVDERLN